MQYRIDLSSRNPTNKLSLDILLKNYRHEVDIKAYYKKVWGEKEGNNERTSIIQSGNE